MSDVVSGDYCTTQWYNVVIHKYRSRAENEIEELKITKIHKKM